MMRDSTFVLPAASSGLWVHKTTASKSLKELSSPFASHIQHNNNNICVFLNISDHHMHMLTISQLLLKKWNIKTHGN
jgi:hypothetical protein